MSIDSVAVLASSSTSVTLMSKLTEFVVLASVLSLRT
jgi:hypothetical protein